MKKISLAIIFFFIIACAGSQKKKWSVKDFPEESNFNIYSQHWNTIDDSLNLFLHMQLPLNRFVFKKSFDHFFSDIIYTLVISHAEEDIQIYRESWIEKVTLPYYENTRNPDNHFTTERNIKLIPGSYRVFVNIQDEDSRRNWQLNKEYDLKPVNILGPVLPFINNEDLKKIIAVNIVEKIDTIWLRTQIHLQETSSDQNEIFHGDVVGNEIIKEMKTSIDSTGFEKNYIDYIINRKTTTVDSGKVKLIGSGINDLYYLPIPMNQHKRSWYEIKLNYHGKEQTIPFSYRIEGRQYWTDNIDELIGVMRYILSSHSEYKKLENLEESSQWNYINKYWEEKDPLPETEENELLRELNDRVSFVNKNFSLFMAGWKSDRGRIYIIHGPPQYDEYYQDKMGDTYLKWVYPNGKEFIFIDRNMTGDYSLYHGLY